MDIDSGAEIELFDSHAHLDDPRLTDDLDNVLARAREAGINEIITVGTNPDNWVDAVEIARAHEGIRATAGCHPHDASSFGDAEADQLIEICALPEVVALGEIGLDYHYDNSPRDAQRDAFARQLEMAGQLELPVIVHCREASQDCLSILKDAGAGLRGVAHCFSGTDGDADALLELEFHISFSGTVTFPSAAPLAEIARRIPEDRLLIETDCPYLAPQLRRGKRNEPSYVRFVAEKLAQLRNTDTTEIARVTTRNARALFGSATG